MSSNILQISAVGEMASAPTRHAEESCRLHDGIKRAWAYAAGIWRSWQGNILPASSPSIQTQKQHNQTQGVFDVSAESTNGHSLNDSVDWTYCSTRSFSIMLRFRTHQSAFTANIEMYQQIRVHSMDTRLH